MYVRSLLPGALECILVPRVPGQQVLGLEQPIEVML